jgi:hypothetical protein
MNIHGMLPDKVFIFCVDHKSKLAAADISPKDFFVKFVV